MSNETIFVGVAGGTGSGKTTVAQKIIKAFAPCEVSLIEQDSYYKNFPEMTIEEKSRLNFDHPNSLDFELLAKHMNDLANHKTVNIPIYDFTTHSRKEETIEIKPSRIVVVEGILIFAVKEILEKFDVKLFVDTDDDVRLLRRIERDIKERGRDLESIKKQYLGSVKPMYLEFVDPSKRYADIIIPRGGKNKVAIKMVIAKLRSLL